MNVVKGSDLIGLFASMDTLRFLHVRFATEEALKHGAKPADLKRLLQMWLALTEPQRGEPASEAAVRLSADQPIVSTRA